MCVRGPGPVPGYKITSFLIYRNGGITGRISLITNLYSASITSSTAVIEQCDLVPIPGPPTLYPDLMDQNPKLDPNPHYKMVCFKMAASTGIRLSEYQIMLNCSWYKKQCQQHHIFQMFRSRNIGQNMSRVTEIYETPVQGLQIKNAPDFNEIGFKLFPFDAVSHQKEQFDINFVNIWSIFKL